MSNMTYVPSLIIIFAYGSILFRCPVTLFLIAQMQLFYAR